MILKAYKHMESRKFDGCMQIAKVSHSLVIEVYSNLVMIATHGILLDLNLQLRPASAFDQQPLYEDDQIRFDV